MTAAFVKGPAINKGPIFAHWPSIAIDKAGTLYMVWDTAPSGTAAADRAARAR